MSSYHLKVIVRPYFCLDTGYLTARGSQGIDIAAITAIVPVSVTFICRETKMAFLLGSLSFQVLKVISSWRCFSVLAVMATPRVQYRY